MTLGVARVPVVIVGAGPTGVTAATLLAQYGVDSLVLDRWPDVYPQPRAVHLDDEIYRIVARLGIADEFAAISRPAHGLRLLDNTMRVLAEFRRDTARSVNGFPQANMFDQPEFEVLLRNNLKRHPHATLRGDTEVTGITDQGDGRVRVAFTDRSDGREHAVEADYVLGCDGANSVVRAEIGSAMRDLKFEQRWLVVDVATEADLGQWEGVHQVCDPDRAGTYMRIGDARYRWEFRLLPGETAEDYASLTALKPLIAPWTTHADDDELELIRVTEYTFRAQIADTWRRGNVFLLGDAAHLTPPFIGQGMGAGLRDAVNLSWKLAGRPGRRPPPSGPGQLRAGAKTTHPRLDPTRAHRRAVDDVGRRARQSDSSHRRSADAPHPRPAGQGRRQRNARTAPLRAGAPIAQAAAARRKALPEPGARRRPPAGRAPRHRLRSHLGGARQRRATSAPASSAAPPSISPGPAPISPTGCGAVTPPRRSFGRTER